MIGNELHNNIDRVYRVGQDQDNGDDFGLPNTGSSSQGGSASKSSVTTKKTVVPPKKSSSGGVVVVIVIALVILAFLVYWFLIRKPPVPKPVPVKQDTTAVQKPDTIVQVPVTPAHVEPTVGEIDTITMRTGRYYVIISASIDDDLAHDYAMKLSQQGVSSKILGSVNKKGYHQLSIADFATMDEANAKAEELKGNYGSEIWVMKY